MCQYLYNRIMEIKQIKTLERVFKGVGNHYRIKTLLLIDKSPEISLDEIVRALKANYFTISEHVNRLRIAGLISKKYKGKYVIHTLTPYGNKIITILNNFFD